MKKIIDHFNFERTISIIQTIILLAGFIVAYLELNNIKETTSGNLSLQLFEDMASDRVFKNNPGIVRAIIEDRPILKENGGSFSDDDLDNYLILFNWADAANKSGVLSDEMVYNLHSDLLLSSYDNQEVKNYIDNLQKENPYYYLGFVDLAKRMGKYDEE